MDSIKRYIIGAGIAGALFLAYGLVGSADRAEAGRQENQYCKMVQIWQETDGDAGWPDYKNNFNEVCND